MDGKQNSGFGGADQAPLLAFLTKIWSVIGNATGYGCLPCPFCLESECRSHEFDHPDWESRVNRLGGDTPYPLEEELAVSGRPYLAFGSGLIPNHEPCIGRGS